MKGYYLTALFASIAAAFAAMQTTLATFDVWAVLDKYGFPTAMLTLTILFIWNRQKKSDNERNEIINRNNDLTQELINAVKMGNACRFIEQNKEGK